MHTRDYTDIIGGVVLLAIGAFVAIYALTSLRLGTVIQMGPGMFPAALGVILAFFGLLILIPALGRAGEMPSGDLRALLTILAALLAFALMARPFGMVPAIVVLTLIGSRADSKLSLLWSAVLAAVLSLFAVLIFRVGLGIQLAVFAWPW